MKPASRLFAPSVAKTHQPKALSLNHFLSGPPDAAQLS
jgi:hypothetical protein